jgi:hypothetical protein
MLRRLTLLARPVACWILLASAALSLAAGPGLALEPTAIGNLFAPDQPVRFRLTVPAGIDKVSWSVTDFHGIEVAQGDQAAAAPLLTVKLDKDKVGFFTLRIRAGNGEEAATRTTTFAILPDYDFAAVDDSPFGICTHFGQGVSGQIIPLLARAGIKEIRDEQYWGGIENKKGVFVFPASDEAYMKQLAAAHIIPHIGLTYSNALYDDGKAPYDDEGFRAFGQYAAQLVQHYRGLVRSVEVWNEWNSPGFCPGPAASKPEVYRGLLEATYRAVKSVDPRVKVVGCSTTGLFWGGYDWLHRFFHLPGALAVCDAVSTHPYNTALAPEFLTESATKTTAMMKDAGGPVRPLWITEIGYTINSDPKAVADQVYESLSNRITEDVQALYIVRIYVLLLAAGAEKVYWYDFMNDGNDPRNGEHNFGLIRHPGDARGDYAPKPSYVAVATMTRQLTDAQFVQQEQTPPGMRCFVFRRHGQDIRVAWSLEPMVFQVKANGPFTVVDLMGQAHTITPENGVAALPVRTGEPFYVVGPVEQIGPGLTIHVESHVIAAVGEPIGIDYSVDNALPGPRMITLGFRNDATSFTAEPGARNLGNHGLPPSAQTKVETVPCGVSYAGMLLDTIAVQVHVADPVSLAHAPYISDGSHLTATLRNNSQHATTIKSLHWKAGDTQGDFAANLQIEPGKQADLAIPDVSLEPYAILPLTLQLNLDGDRQCSYEGHIANCPIYQRTIRVENPLQDCAKLPAIDLTRHGVNKIKDYKGPADLSGSIWLAYDQKNFYLVARITDDVHFQPFAGAEVWTGDSIQFALSPAAPWETKDFYEFALALTPQGPQVYQFSSARAQEWPGLVKDAVCRITRSGTQTLYAVAIPRQGRPWPAEGAPCLAVSLLVNDNDGSGRKGWIEWAGGMAQGKFPAQFSPCYLAPAPAPKP